MSEISKAFERELRALASIKNAKGYAAWLGTKTASESDRARLENAAKESRLGVDFGASGEALSRTGLSDDGYAAYLREAAKQQRDSRAMTIESERAAEASRSLAGYRDYLLSLRRADEESLLDAAEDVLTLEREQTGALSRILDAADATAAQRRALTYAHRHYANEGHSKENAATLRFLFENHYNYDRAYEYCLMIGIDPALAHRMATASDEALSQNWNKVYDLFGDVLDP